MSRFRLADMLIFTLNNHIRNKNVPKSPILSTLSTHPGPEHHKTACGSAWLEYLVWDQGVAGSNPVTPIIRGSPRRRLSFERLEPLLVGVTITHDVPSLLHPGVTITHDSVTTQEY